MTNRNRLTFAIVGGVFCAIVGSLLGGVAVVLIRACVLAQREMEKGRSPLV